MGGRFTDRRAARVAGRREALRLRAAWFVVGAIGAMGALCAGGPTGAAAPDPISAAAALGHPRDVVVEDTRRIAFVSSVNGRGYSLDIALPDTPPPKTGYPVIYVFDGDRYFATVVGAVRLNENAPGAIVVGIGYPRDPAWAEAVLKRHQPLPPRLLDGHPFAVAVDLEREVDFTLPADAEDVAWMKSMDVKMSLEDYGGVDAFLKTIEVDVKPRVAAMAPMNKDDQTLFGHSLGGLAVVEALFTEPGAYRTFVIASPSIWRTHAAILKHEAAFDAAVVAGEVAPRVIVTVGALEETMPKIPPEYAYRAPIVKANLLKSRLLTNACALAGRLKALKGRPGYEVADCAVFEGQGHGVSPWPAIGRGVAFAFPN